MTAANLTCREVRLAIGAEPHSVSGDVTAHLETCEACRRFRDETLKLDRNLRAALELPLSEFRKPAVRPARRFALAASLVFGLLIAGTMWVVLPQPALAGDVIEHALHEPGSWDGSEVVPADQVAAVLKAAGVEFDSSMPITYAAPCPFHGRRMAHLVLQTATGPLTVMLLPRETVSRRREFAEDGMRGVLLPAGAGAVAVLARDGVVPATLAAEIVSAVRW